MELKKIRSLIPVSVFRRLSRKQWGLIVGGLFLLLAIVYAVVFWDKTVVFSYQGKTCISRTTLFPGLFRASNSDGLAVELTDRSGFDGRLVSKSLCVTPTQTPRQGEQVVAVSLFGSPLLRQRLVVKTDTPPVVDVTKLSRPVATHVPLELPISATDKVHHYFLRAGNDTAPCASLEKVIRCNIAELDLKQGAEYVLSVGRQFREEQPGILVEKQIKTLSPISLVNSSIAVNETVYSVPQSIEITFDKQIVDEGKVVLERIEGETRTTIASDKSVKGASLSIKLKEALVRSSKYELRLTDMVAKDGSTLYENSYVHPFTTSGGPRVTGVNVGRSGVGQQALVAVTFDQTLSTSQDISSLVKFSGGNATISRQGNKLLFQLNSLPLCTDFSIQITNDLQSSYGIAGNSGWSFSSRTICHTISTIGYTVKGRAITAYRFGAGASTILYLGLTHGNEGSTYTLLSQWIDELEANARSIPTDKSVIVIPALNRDGLALGSRRNANNVDLNRNFPTADWKTDVTMPGGQMVTGGGGSAPLSEPESSAIASYTQQLAPRLVLTYHSVAGLVTPNEAGVSTAYAATYSSLSGYYLSPKASASEVFDYDTTGAYEDWLYEKTGIAAILVELGSNTSPQTSRNYPAMWAMMK